MEKNGKRCRSRFESVLGPGLSTEPQSKQESPSDLLQPLRMQRRDQGPRVAFRHRLEVIKVDGAGGGRAILLRQEHLARDVSDSRRDGGDGDLAEDIEDRVPGEDQLGAPLVRPGEPVPADLSSPLWITRARLAPPPSR